MSRTEAARRLRPFPGLVLAVESPVDEEERPSGLIVPLQEKTTGWNEAVRAVVVAVGPGGHRLGSEILDDLSEGSVVYFARDHMGVSAYRLLDVWVVSPVLLLAYEGPDG